MLEGEYQNHIIKEIKAMFPNCFVLKNDSDYMQGIPDLLVLERDMWAMLEVKTSKKARNRPNQVYYVCTLDDMSFAAFIYPENEVEVLDALQLTFGASRSTRIS